MNLLRALLAFLALPGVVAYLVPLLLASARSGLAPTESPLASPGPPIAYLRLSGVVLVLGGSALLLWCVREFYVAGKGTLAPWSPPQHLVTSGPYRRSRNPMYVAVACVLLGWAAWFASPALLLYAAVVILAFHLRVILYEEPRLAAGFGEEWMRYRERVRRWV